MKKLVAGLSLGLLAACGGTVEEERQDERLSVSQLYLGSLCGGEQHDPRVRYLDREEAWQQVVEAAGKHEVGGEAAEPPQIDFNDTAVLWVEMGEKRTGGYWVELGADTMTVVDGVAEVRVNWHTPEPDAMLTQAITSPCLAVAVPQGDYETVRVVDLEGQIRAEVDL
ncbi:hypothetical protein CAI21_08125 [Alkalilimnicola ehrlichii]|uniref:PrcB C-terminal domain-containing protein n=1 Tax=Alkalilimnicola ehrlichii TaxID=351052 RepID=A0A3E0WWW4_9GAMM|nr:protease complex subunit PrcB family protein [Alkalilimnicola ehrlichii]RFA30146.1 hypothetical protein CAI21_08125 [Alkalilimnicola ehrlichii]RFA37494.1 hypothetical protein CAL65_09470 [Alkalilimnicola ehrlichii]